MAASTMRKQIAAPIAPTTLPPMSTSASDPPSAPATRAVRGPWDSEYMPTAKMAGRPAPAIRPNTTIFQSAVRLIQDISALPFSLRSDLGGLGGSVRRGGDAA